MAIKIYELVSSIYMYVYVDDLDTAEANRIIGKKSRRIPHPKPESPSRVDYIWTLNTKWHWGEDAQTSLENFLFTQLPEISEGITKIQEQGARIELDWVIGVGDLNEDTVLPSMPLSSRVIAELNKWKFELEIFLDTQIDAEQVGLKP